MKIVTDPRCPTHPTFGLYQRWQRPGDMMIWVCAACSRPLGLASFCMGTGAPWPRGRRLGPRDLAFAKIDWDYMLALDERGGTDR